MKLLLFALVANILAEALIFTNPYFLDSYPDKCEFITSKENV
jgi:hypothetical protein